MVDEGGRLVPVWGFLAAHHGLRRDVARLVAALAAMTDHGTEPERLAALQDHWRLFHQILELHHQAEDTNLFPLLRDRCPELAPLVDQLDTEHEALADLLPQIDSVVERLPAAGAIDAARDAMNGLESTLEAHLSAEEEHLVPRMLDLLAADPSLAGPPPDAAEDQEEDPGPISPVLMLVWSADGLDPDVLGLVLDASPPRIQDRYPEQAEAYQATLARWT
jgi:hemerythrin-like domain-containing protein